MSGIYISGAKMPSEKGVVTLRIWGNGQVEQLVSYNAYLQFGVTAMDVPDHGRLIDADALNDMINRSYPMTDRVDIHNGYAICQEMMKALPTIIPADKDGAE